MSPLDCQEDYLENMQISLKHGYAIQKSSSDFKANTVQTKNV